MFFPFKATFCYLAFFWAVGVGASQKSALSLIPPHYVIAAMEEAQRCRSGFKTPTGCAHSYHGVKTGGFVFTDFTNIWGVPTKGHSEGPLGVHQGN